MLFGDVFFKIHFSIIVDVIVPYLRPIENIEEIPILATEKQVCSETDSNGHKVSKCFQIFVSLSENSILGPFIVGCFVFGCFYCLDVFICRQAVKFAVNRK